MSDTINVSNISFDKGKIKGCSVSISGKIFTVKWEGGQYKVEAGGTAAAAANTPAAAGANTGGVAVADDPSNDWSFY
jgi:hypothetical protein